MDAGHIVVTNINSSKLDLVDNFLKSYVKPTSNLVNKGDNIFANVSFSSAIYDFILDDNMALLVKSTNLDIYNDFIKITDIDENNSQTSLTYKVQDDKETLKIVGVNGKNEIVYNETTKRYSTFVLYSIFRSCLCLFFKIFQFYLRSSSLHRKIRFLRLTFSRSGSLHFRCSG